MDATQAIADLMEISSQVRAAVVAGADGTVEASSPSGDAGERLAQAARRLLEGAGSVRGADSTISQVEAAARDGSVFVVRDGGRIVAATTGPSPTVGLVFYDLKTCLRALGGSEGQAA